MSDPSECHHTIISKTEIIIWLIIGIIFLALLPLYDCSYCNVEDKCTLIEIIGRMILW